VPGLEPIGQKAIRQTVGNRRELGCRESALALVPLVVTALGVLLRREVRQSRGKAPIQCIARCESSGGAGTVEEGQAQEAKSRTRFLKARIGEFRRLVAPV